MIKALGIGMFLFSGIVGAVTISIDVSGNNPQTMNAPTVLDLNNAIQALYNKPTAPQIITVTSPASSGRGRTQPVIVGFNNRFFTPVEFSMLKDGYIVTVL